MRRTRRVVVCAAAALVFLAVTAFAADVTTIADGDWNVGANWDSASIPGASDRAILWGNDMFISSNAPTVNQVWLQRDFGDLFHSNGFLTVSDYVWIGDGTQAGWDASYYMFAGGLTANKLLIDGRNHVTDYNAFCQDGGLVDVKTNLVGDTALDMSKGAYHMSNGTLLVSDRFEIAHYGLFDQAGGSITSRVPIRFTFEDCVYELRGGDVCVTNETPFIFATNAPGSFFNFHDGGVLLLHGVWDHASLVGIANSDFRVEGRPVSAGDLDFATGSIGGRVYTFVAADVVVEALPPSNVTPVSADFNGRLAADGTGAVSTGVYVFWGESDGGEDSSAWQNTNWMAMNSNPRPENYSTNFALSPNRRYFYRFFATNVSGGAWSPPMEVATVSMWSSSTQPVYAVEGGATGVVTFYRSSDPATNPPIRLNYNVFNGDGADPGDYAALPGFVYFPAGQTSVNVTVTPIDDTDGSSAEAKEYVRIAVDSNQHVLGATDYGHVWILDNDLPDSGLHVADGGGGTWDQETSWTESAFYPPYTYPYMTNHTAKLRMHAVVTLTNDQQIFRLYISADGNEDGGVLKHLSGELTVNDQVLLSRQSGDNDAAIYYLADNASLITPRVRIGGSGFFSGTGYETIESENYESTVFLHFGGYAEIGTLEIIGASAWDPSKNGAYVMKRDASLLVTDQFLIQGTTTGSGVGNVFSQQWGSVTSYVPVELMATGAHYDLHGGTLCITNETPFQFAPGAYFDFGSTNPASLLLRGGTSVWHHSSLTNIPNSDFRIDNVAITNGSLDFTEITNAGVVYALVTIALPASPIPAVSNMPATDVAATSALLNGNLLSTGNAPTELWIFWGTTDGAEVKDSWVNSNYAAYKAAGVHNTNLFALSPDTVYYYRWYATNAYGDAWAPASEVFITGDINVMALDSLGAESGPDPASFLFTRPAPCSGPDFMIDYAISGTASNGDDYSPLSGTVVIPSGQTSATVVVTPVDDAQPEGNETVILTVMSGPYVTGAQSSDSVTIIDSDAVPLMANATPADISTSSATLRGNLLSTGAAATEVWVYWGITDGTSNKWLWEYTNYLGFPLPGLVDTNVTGLPADTQYFYRFYASNAYGEVWSEPSTNFRTMGLPDMFINDLQVLENDTQAVFTVTLSHTSDAMVSVEFCTVDGLAVAGTDYASTNGMLFIPAGMSNGTIVVKLLDDLDDEGFGEDFGISLSNAANATLVKFYGNCLITDDDFDDSLWEFRMQITLEGYTKPTSLMNFPVLVVFNESIPGFSYDSFNSADGYDLRFTDIGENTELHFEVEEWNTNGNSYVWVRVPMLVSTNTSIWAFWGNDGATNPPPPEAAEGVWQEEFEGVWHMTEADAYDSTVNQNDGTAANGVTSNIGVVSLANSFNGTSSRITVSDHESLDGHDVMTFSFWYKRNGLGGGGQGTMYSKGTAGGDPYCMRHQGDGKYRASINGSTTAGVSDSLSGLWQHVAMVYDGSSMFYYLDGYIDQNAGASLGSVNSSVDTLYIGNDSSGTRAIDAVLDEFRISSAARSSDWIWACYMNQASNATFNSYGPVEKAFDGTIIMIDSTAPVAPGSNAIPYVESFESFPPGYSMSNEPGWLLMFPQESGADITNAPDHGLRSPYIMGETHSNVVDIWDGASCVLDKRQDLTNIYADIMIKPEGCDVPPTHFDSLPEGDGMLPQVAVCVHTNSELLFYHSHFETSSYERCWTVNDTMLVNTGEFVRLTFSMKYNASSYGDGYFQLQVNGLQPCSNSLGYSYPGAADVMNTPDGGTWFLCANADGIGGNGWIPSVSFDGAVQVDDLVVTYQPPPAPPAVDNDGGAGGVTMSSATLNGNLWSTGGSPTEVWIYWGMSDGTTNKGMWDSLEYLGILGEGPFSTNLNALSPGTPYFYRCYASNAVGGSWAPTTTNFTTTGGGGGPIIYVDVDATGLDNGMSWTDAYTNLQDAVAAAVSNDEIWVAAGTYVPSPSDRYVSFNLKPYVSLFGGFGGFETNVNDRDRDAYPAVLSGDLYNNDIAFSNNEENAYHVVVGADNAVLDGFIVKGGNADGAMSWGNGGGMWNSNASPAVVNCTFAGNRATSGGGMYNDSAYPLIEHTVFAGNSAYDGGAVFNTTFSQPTNFACAFVGNSAVGGGGAIYNNSNTVPCVKDCVLTDNSADKGGAILGHAATVRILRSVLVGNSASMTGGAVCVEASTVSEMRNCVVAGNTAEAGGGLLSDWSYAHAENCTFSGNHAQRGGAIAAAPGRVYLTNTILWGDTGLALGDEIYVTELGTAFVTYCDIAGGLSGMVSSACVRTNGTNLDVDPLFVVGTNGSLFTPATYNSNTFQSVLHDSGWFLSTNEFADKFINPNTDQPLQFLIVSNAQQDLYVWGDITGIATMSTPYAVYDYHLQSTAGRWQSGLGMWTSDAANSPCVDAGHPLLVYAGEPEPNGNVINMGAYGNTPEASKSDTAQITITQPGPGVTWPMGSVQTIEWNSTDCGSNVTIDVSYDNGNNWDPPIITTATNVNGANQLEWVVYCSAATEDAILRITDTENALNYDQTDSSFTIAEIQLTAPIGNPDPQLTEHWEAGQLHYITWASVGGSGFVNIDLSTDSGTNWTPIDMSVPDTGSYEWTVPDPRTKHARVRVVSTMTTNIADESDYDFHIVPGPVLLDESQTWSSPPSLAGWKNTAPVGTESTVLWNSNTWLSITFTNLSFPMAQNDIIYTDNNGYIGDYQISNLALRFDLLVEDQIPSAIDVVFHSGASNRTWTFALAEPSLGWQTCTIPFNYYAGWYGVVADEAGFWFDLKDVEWIGLDITRSFNTSQEDYAIDNWVLTVSLPIIYNMSASNITETSAEVIGDLASTGDSPAFVTLYWGETDCGTINDEWDYVWPCGYREVGLITTNLTGLSADTTYYYRFAASNAAGEMWAPYTFSFDTAFDDNVIFVDYFAAGDNSGLNWSNAFFDLQSALAAAVSNDNIWVAAATYTPDAVDRYASFVLKPGVNLYGGFGGWETVVTQRNPAANPTILSGDLFYDDAGPSNRSDNSYHVVIGADNAILDGFTIVGGNADLGGQSWSRGGGMYNSNAYPAVVNCTFAGNMAAQGGAVFNDWCAPEFVNCAFQGNFAGMGGGAMYNTWSAPSNNACVFVGNSADYGGAVLSTDSSAPVFDDCLFAANRSADDGGALWFESCNATLRRCGLIGNMAATNGAAVCVSSADPVMINCLFAGNESQSGAGVSAAGDSIVSLSNCTLSDNSAAAGGAVAAVMGTVLGMENCIVWNNSASWSGNQGYIEAGTVFVGFCDIPAGDYELATTNGGVVVTNGIIVTRDPLFVGGTNGMWTLDASFSVIPYRSTLTDGGASWTPGELVGKTLTPDTNYAFQCWIVSNSPTTITVLGDLSTNLLNGQPYAVRDYHLQSAYGHWRNDETWDYDDAMSPAVDFGDPGVAPYGEPDPAGNRINMGAYGNTEEASKSDGISAVYVSDAASGRDNGTTWADAFTNLQDALSIVIDDNLVRVGQGVYKPRTASRAGSFRMVEGVDIYGGYLGVGTNADERDWMEYETVLSGDINGDDVGFTNNTENSFHVVRGASDVIIDGFVITGGNADQVFGDDSRGGGMLNIACERLSVRNCVFLNNFANDGGGMHNDGGDDVYVFNCLFYGNRADNVGGMNNTFCTNLVLNTIFRQNADLGGTNESSQLREADVRYSCIEGYTNVAGLGNTNGNPLFADVNTSDFTLRAGSPCIDAGINMEWMYAVGGSDRILNEIVDMGPHEYSSFVSIRALLQGAYAGSGLMRTDLQSGGHLPLTSPYAADERTVAAAPSSCTDWILVEVRATTNGEALFSRSAFLQDDGCIIDEDGSTNMTLEVPANGSCYLVLKHRNHLTVMSALAVNITNMFTVYDFTTSSNQFYGGTNAAVELEPGVWGMVAGDADCDGTILPADQLVSRSQTNLTGYRRGDFGLDADVAADDVGSFCTTNIGRSTAVPDGSVLLTSVLEIDPARKTIVLGDSNTLHAIGSTGEIFWAFVENLSGGTLTPSGTSVVYETGATSDVIDVVQAWDRDNLLGRAYLNVISPSEVSRAGKAIVIAGRKGQSDPLWETTGYLADLAYNTLRYRGFSKDNLQYLAPEVDVDVDENGLLDDIDLESTLANVELTFTNWALGAADLFVYLVDHGGEESSSNGYFRLGPSEKLTASDLCAWLDNLQNKYTNDVTVIIDACRSGSFIDELAYTGAAKRVVIAACADDEATYFVAGGLVSFSDAFFSGVLLGLDTMSCFDLARDAMSGYQSAQIDDDKNGLYEQGIDGAVAETMYIGATFVAGKDRPWIGSVNGNQILTDGSTATLWADDVVSEYEIDNVWCTIVHPTYAPDPDDPVSETDDLDLDYDTDTGRYQSTFDGFSEDGTYKVMFYARDIWGSVSDPKQSYVSQLGFDERVVLVAAGPTNTIEWTNHSFMATLAYYTLRTRLFDNEHIYYLSANTNQDFDLDGTNDVDALPTLANLASAVTNWAAEGDKATIYLIGQGTNNTLRLNASETLDGITLCGWADNLQDVKDAPLNVIMDFAGAGAFVPALATDDDVERIVIASTKSYRRSLSKNRGIVSFSQYFLGQIFDGQAIGNAFTAARKAIRKASGRVRQRAEIDDNCNGVANEKNTDGLLAQERYIGTAFLTGAESPCIGSVMPITSLPAGTNELLIWVGDVLDEEGISNVWCVVTDPWYDGTEELPETNLTYNAPSNRYETLLTGLTNPGSYLLTFYAMDNSGEVSPPVQSEILLIDAYEPDDTEDDAVLYNGVPQLRTFHSSNDVDWVKFYAVSNFAYDIETFHYGTNTDTIIDIYFERPDGTLTNIDHLDDFGFDEGEYTGLDFPTNGFYYVQVSRYLSNGWTAGSYELAIEIPAGASDNLIIYVVDTMDETAVPAGTVVILDGVSTQAFGASAYVTFSDVPAGNHTVEVPMVFGYWPVEDPNTPGQVADPNNAAYGNPKTINIPNDAFSVTFAIFLIIPYAEIDGLLNDQLTGEPVEGAKIEFTATSGKASGITYEGYPHGSSYQTNWYSLITGSFPTNILLPPADWNLAVTRDGHSNLVIVGAVLGSSPGDVINLGSLEFTPADTNANGIGDGWEEKHFPGTNCVPSNDSDDDGLTEYEEYVCGTDPTNAASALEVSGCSNVAAGVSMTWGVEAGRVYRVVGMEKLCDCGCWSTVGGPWTATVGQVQMEWTDTNALSRANWFYQVEVLIP